MGWLYGASLQCQASSETNNFVKVTMDTLPNNYSFLCGAVRQRVHSNQSVKYYLS